MAGYGGGDKFRGRGGGSRGLWSGSSVLRLGNPGGRGIDCYERREVWTSISLGANMWYQGVRFCKIQDL